MNYKIYKNLLSLSCFGTHEIPFLFLSVFWHKYIPVLRKTSEKKGQSVKHKANDTDPLEIHIISSSSDDFKSPPKKKKPCNRGKKIKISGHYIIIEVNFLY